MDTYTHGGKRPNAGRKPLTPTEPTVKVAVTLLASQVEAMTQLGNGNLSRGIRKAIKIMNTKTYYISEAMLGDEATEQDARRMVELLTEKGYDVEYGNRFNRTDEDDIATRDWEDALDIISQEKYE